MFNSIIFSYEISYSYLTNTVSHKIVELHERKLTRLATFRSLFWETSTEGEKTAIITTDIAFYNSQKLQKVEYVG